LLSFFCAMKVSISPPKEGKAGWTPRRRWMALWLHMLQGMPLALSQSTEQHTAACLAVGRLLLCCPNLPKSSFSKHLDCTDVCFACVLKEILYSNGQRQKDNVAGRSSLATCMQGWLCQIRLCHTLSSALATRAWGRCANARCCSSKVELLLLLIGRLLPACGSSSAPGSGATFIICFRDVGQLAALQNCCNLFTSCSKEPTLQACYIGARVAGKSRSNCLPKDVVHVFADVAEL
jgi:hypothetical protein